MNKKSKMIFEKTKKITNSVWKKAQVLVELSQINLKISSIKNKIKKKCAIIGALVVSKNSGELKKIEPDEYDNKIEKLCQDIKKLKQILNKTKHEAFKIKKQLNYCGCDDCSDQNEKDSDETYETYLNCDDDSTNSEEFKDDEIVNEKDVKIDSNFEDSFNQTI